MRWNRLCQFCGNIVTTPEWICARCYVQGRHKEASISKLAV